MEFLFKLLIILVINEIENTYWILAWFKNFLQIVLCVKLNSLTLVKLNKNKGPHWPNIGLPENVETIWLTIPNAGIIKI
jgi:hypothetical protein